MEKAEARLANDESSVILLTLSLSITTDTPTEGRGGVQQNDSLSPMAQARRMQLASEVGTQLATPPHHLAFQPPPRLLLDYPPKQWP